MNTMSLSMATLFVIHVKLHAFTDPASVLVYINTRKVISDAMVKMVDTY